MLYRVIVRETTSLQPGFGSTFWTDRCLYCGYDKADARRVYWEAECRDEELGYGNRCRRTKFQQVPEADDVRDERPVDVAAEEE